MKMFITGGTSSIGRVFIREISRQGIPICALVRKNSNRDGLALPGVEFAAGDVTDPQSVRQGMAGCTHATHLAAIVGQDVPEAEWWRVNRDGSRNMLQAARELGFESVVQISSLSVLGCTQPGEIADESRPIDPRRHVNLYQKTKFAADEIARGFAGNGLPVKIVYPAFGYGCSQATSHPSLQDQTLLRMADGKPVAVMGSGKNKLCLAYYRDTVAGIMLAHQNGKPGEGYILGNDNLTFVEIWAQVARVLGKDAPRMRIPLPALKIISNIGKIISGKVIFPDDFFDMVALNWRFSSQKAREQLGWEPHTFAEGIAETWAEYREIRKK